MPAPAKRPASAGAATSLELSVAAILCSLLLFCFVGSLARLCCYCHRRKGKQDDRDDRDDPRVSQALLVDASAFGSRSAGSKAAPAASGKEVTAQSAAPSRGLPDELGSATAKCDALSHHTPSRRVSGTHRMSAGPERVPLLQGIRTYGTTAPPSSDTQHRCTGEGAVPCVLFTANEATAAAADELEEEYACVGEEERPWVVPVPDENVGAARVVSPVTLSLSSRNGKASCGSASAPHRAASAASAAAFDVVVSQEPISPNIHMPGADGRHNAAVPRSPMHITAAVAAAAGVVKVSPATAAVSLHAEDGGEAATTLQDIDARLSSVRLELRGAERELHLAVQSTKRERAELVRVTAEVEDMQQYKRTLDGMIAFTVNELESAVRGVEEAEEKLVQSSAAVKSQHDSLHAALRDRTGTV
ncbi:hypothetical protein NESM_000784700 [Novymonas esmeraldas]|uniref:Uncharacterized protein n=1 Tax=Novymonas esmeraldas TaxID=1808958 RepID=A0AAW0EVK5_9TRYP